jgi:hypothetical protein
MNYIYPILLGNDNDTLFGSKNDIIIIYNLFYKFYLNKILKWYKPHILFNSDLTINNLINLIKKINNLDSNIIIIIYFSGHSNKKGYLNFNNEFISSNNIIHQINSCLIKKIDLYFIIDSCFSKNFISNFYKFSNVNKIYFLVSCLENEYSKEIETEYNKNMFKYKNIKKKNKIIISIFTLYFIKLIEARNIDNIFDFKKIVDDKLWKMISNKYNQTIFYNEYIQ